MIDTYTIESYVKKACDQISFERVCQLSKEEFIKLLTTTFSEILNSEELSNGISIDLAARCRIRR